MNFAGQWVGVLGAPLVWLVCLQVNYSLAPWACHTGQKNVLGVATIVALILVLGAGAAAWITWRAAGATAATEEGGEHGRSRFMALAGLGVSGLIALLVLASFVPIAVLEACD